MTKIDEHSFRHQQLVYTTVEVKQKKPIGILRDDRIKSLKEFLARIPREKVKEVCINMKEGLRRVVQEVFPLAKVVVDPFHVVAYSNQKMDEARRIEQEVQKRKIRIPKRIFLMGREKLTEKGREKVDTLLRRYPALKGFYWAKEKIRELYRQINIKGAARILNNLILKKEML